MTIDDIYQCGEISVRSYNVCCDNNLLTILDIKKYYDKHKTFEYLKNCGRKSNEELIKICNNLNKLEFDRKFIEEEKDTFKRIVSKLSRTQRDVINSFMMVNTDSLSIRSQNALKLYLENNLKIQSFADKILCNYNFNLRTIKNIGTKSVKELEVYIDIIKDFLNDVSKSEDEKKMISLKNRFLIQKTFSLPKIPENILESESIFQLTKFLLDQNVFFEGNQAVIFKKTFSICQDTKKTTLDEIGKELNLTRERVRQVRINCFEELFQKLLFLQNFNDDLFQKYNIDITFNSIQISDELVGFINNFNHTDFTKEFIIYVLFAYLSDSFSLIGNSEDVLLFKSFNSKNRHNWDCLYLLKNELADKYDFIALANDISNRLNDKIEETYNFNFKSYLYRFLANEDLNTLNEIIPFAEKLINIEFGIYIDLEDNLTFKRNTSKQVYEYAYEALEVLGMPSKVEEIYNKVKELYPNYETEEAKIRSSMKRKDGFIPIGRKSVFGLKKWEKEFDDFKGGTIRSIAVEYLEKSNEPKKLMDIAAYVLKYRPKSNLYSISQNLKLDESGLFLFFTGSEIGLSTKKYKIDYIQLSQISKSSRKTWRESYELVTRFINEKKRLPYSTDCPEEEQVLYRWFNVQKNKINKGKLESEKGKLIIEIDEKFPQTKKKRMSNSAYKNKPKESATRSKYSINELNKFIIQNQRIPDYRENDEKNLYQYYRRIKKKLEKFKAVTDEEREFMDLITQY